MTKSHRTADLARAFSATGSFKYNPAGFKLASGATSPYYVDCRLLLSYPAPRQLVAELAFTVIGDLAFDCLGGLEIGAIPIATTIADFGYGRGREWRTFVVRKQVKDHGLGKQIEGAIRPGDRALIVDDVLTSGGSVLKAIATAREAGLKVEHALVLVDRHEQNGRAAVEATGVRLLTLLSIEDLQAASGRSHS